jgi:YaiO family outer membrane protein
MLNRKLVLLSWLALLLGLQPLAAQSANAEELFAQARLAAFDQKNYPLALERCRMALALSPDYTDIRVLMGRVYFWNGQADSAALTLDRALQLAPQHADANLAAGSIAYYLHKYSEALRYCNTGLQFHPASDELLLLKTKVLISLRRYNEALSITDTLLCRQPPVKEARLLAERIKDYRSTNRIGIKYDYTNFSKQFDQAWHLASAEYTRQTRMGPVTARINYGHRFGQSGWQVEADAYPRFSRKVYAYMSMGYSPDCPIFPKFRSGFSLYISLPKSFELDAGFRYLHFNEDTWIFTSALGKYYQNWWFNLRAYITPSSSRIAQAYEASTRYYLSGADDYLSLSLGTGLSPDERNQAILLNSNYKLITRRVSAAYYFSCKKMNLFSVGLSWANVEYLPKTRDNQINASIGYHRRF